MGEGAVSGPDLHPDAGSLPADLQISAETGAGLDALVAALAEALPESPPFYGPADVTDRPMRFLVAELVREVAFEELGQEIPYQTAVETIEETVAFWL